MNARGLTLLETLLALSLLASLALAATGWTTSLTRGARTHNERGQWERAALAVLDRITDDLTTFDNDPFLAEDRRTPRVRLDTDTLEIDTRRGRPVTVLYTRLDDGTLHESVEPRTEQSRRPRAAGPPRPPMLGGVHRFKAVVPDDRPERADDPIELRLTIHGPHAAVERRWTLRAWEVAP